MIAINNSKAIGLSIDSNNIFGIANSNEIIFKKKNAIANVYGIKRQLNSSSSDWIRTDAAEGLVAECARKKAEIGTKRNDFDNIYPWSGMKTINYDAATDKVIAYYGNPSFSFTKPQVMVIVPEFYWKRYRDSEYEYIQIADGPMDGFNKSDAFLVARFFMADYDAANPTVQASTAQSWADATHGFWKRDITITEFRNLAKKLGPDWGIMDYHYFLIAMLYLVEYATYNNGNSIGWGYGNDDQGASYDPKPGLMNDWGESSGGDGGGNAYELVMYRGIENPFGVVWQFIDGINCKDYNYYICQDPNEYTTTKFTEPYYKLSFTRPTSRNSYYIDSIGYDENYPLFMLPQTARSSAGPIHGDVFSESCTDGIVESGGGGWYYENGWFTISAYLKSTAKGTYDTTRLIKHHFTQ